MLEILAYAPEDGWAYVQNNSTVVLVRPPYTLNSMSTVKPQSVTAALTRHGFVPAPRDRERFQDWVTLLAFLSGQMIESRKTLDEQVAATDLGQSLLAFAPANTLEQFLNRISDELIPNRKWEHADKLLVKMLEQPSLRNHKDLLGRAIDLLSQVRRGQARKQADQLGIAREDADFDRIFPRAAERYGQMVSATAAAIMNRGTVFAFA